MNMHRIRDQRRLRLRNESIGGVKCRIDEFQSNSKFQIKAGANDVKTSASEFKIAFDVERNKTLWISGGRNRIRFHTW